MLHIHLEELDRTVGEFSIDVVGILQLEVECLRAVGPEVVDAQGFQAHLSISLT